jgi:NADH:ubiquinone oxidoreductase subunit 2 (subunit N)
MNFFNSSFDSLVISYSYLLTYNLSLFIFFWTLQQFINTNFKTIYSFNDLRLNFFFTTILTLILFSIAGIPPLIGFFSKILILLLLLNSNFFFLYIYFFGLLFFGLYFYVQNIKFLYSIGKGKIDYSYYEFLRKISIYYMFSFLLIFLLTFGFLVMDDLILYFYWIFK